MMAGASIHCHEVMVVASKDHLRFHACVCHTRALEDDLVNGCSDAYVYTRSIT